MLITGGSSGIGAATALRFARDGAKVAIDARRTEQSEAVVRQIESLGGQGLFIRTDVRQQTDIEALVAGTVARFGRLDCAINNANLSFRPLCGSRPRRRCPAAVPPRASRSTNRRQR
ncbi:MAG: SDR family NAD(P)-dependent oxidoreductase [Acetobacteraceae bacterium]|nr:SDR family NAD(P)-dependent oxidoreductase [Acetobacteraceae bacterium]